jgi:hypothetical protein
MKKGFLIYPFAILWTVFAVFWVVFAYKMTSHDRVSGESLAYIFPLFGVPFIFVGFGMFLAPFIAYYKSKNILYAITSKRAFALQFGKKEIIKSYPFSEFKEEIEIDRNKDGTGSIFFAKRLEKGMHGKMVMRKKGFEYIKEIEKVEDKLRHALDKSKNKTYIF